MTGQVLELPGAQAAAAVVVSAVPVAMLDQMFPQVAPWLVRALEHAPTDSPRADDLWAGCRDGSHVLLVVTHGNQMLGAAVIRKSRAPDGRPLAWFVAVGGNGIELWLRELIEFVKGMARAMGGARLAMLGRPGWARVLKPYGVRTQSVVLMLDDIEPED